MGKAINEIGNKYFKLTVIEKTDKRNSSGQIYWKCICDCGKECVVNGAALRSGHTKSCGCYNAELNKIKGHNRLIDLTNKTFGFIKVIDRAENKILPSGQVKTAWNCKCQCGNIFITTADTLLNKNIKSCGCIKRSKGELLINELLTKNNILFEEEKTFDSCILPSNKKARFDFFVNNQYLIEFDGKQHFIQDAGWDEKLEDIQKRDEFKNNWCIKNNIPLIRIPYSQYDHLCLDDLLLETSTFIYKEEKL